MFDSFDINKLLPDSIIVKILTEICTIEDARQPSLFDYRLSIEMIERSVSVGKSYHWYSIPYSYGPHFRVLIALGGLASHSQGILMANWRFLTLVVSENLKLITYDLHESTY